MAAARPSVGTAAVEVTGVKSDDVALAVAVAAADTEGSHRPVMMSTAAVEVEPSAAPLAMVTFDGGALVSSEAAGA